MAGPTLLAQLRALPPDEWATVQAKVTAFHKLGGGPLPAVDTPPSDDYLLMGIEYELRRRGLLGSREKLWGVSPKFHRVSASVRATLEERAGKIAPPQRIALGRLCARALADYLDNGPAPISGKLLLDNAHKTMTAVENSFPGYLATGLLRFCWQG